MPPPHLASSASAATLQVLHTFCKQLGCGDGGQPTEAIVIDAARNLYGTADYGAHGGGVVYQLSPPVTGDKWTYKVLHHFCTELNCRDGSDPTSSTLIVDVAGNVYGTTAGGGRGNNTGTVFELSPPAKGNQWVLRTIYSFCVSVSSCRDGEIPDGGLTYAGREAGLAYDGISSLYGTTRGGGGKFGGVAYSLTPKGNGHWSEKVLYAFCKIGGRLRCRDGEALIDQMTMDAEANLYGITETGGKSHAGVAYKLFPQEGQRRLGETALHSFCDTCFSYLTAANSALVFDGLGNLFGTTVNGGNTSDCQEGCGQLFSIAPDGTTSILYSFCSQAGCPDGQAPVDRGGIFIDGSGEVYGTTYSGGSNDRGTVFRWNGSALDVLYNFCSLEFCADGASPNSGLIGDGSGHLFGTTKLDNKNAGGTVWELTP